MAIVEDASSPAAVHSTAGTGPYTTAQFSPPANSLIVAMIGADGGASTVTAALSDSGSHTWSLLKRQNTASGGAVGGTAEIWCLYTASGLTNITATATMSGSTAAGANLVVKVLTGAASTQTGATQGASGTGSSTANLSITTTTNGAHVYGAVINYANSTAYTANGSSTIIDGLSDSTNGDWYAAWKASADVGTPGATTLGFTNTSANFNIAAVEILPASGSSFIAAPGVMLRQAVKRAAFW